MSVTTLSFKGYSLTSPEYEKIKIDQKEYIDVNVFECDDVLEDLEIGLKKLEDIYLSKDPKDGKMKVYLTIYKIENDIPVQIGYITSEAVVRLGVCGSKIIGSVALPADTWYMVFDFYTQNDICLEADNVVILPEVYSIRSGDITTIHKHIKRA